MECRIAAEPDGAARLDLVDAAGRERMTVRVLTAPAAGADSSHLPAAAPPRRLPRARRGGATCGRGRAAARPRQAALAALAPRVAAALPPMQVAVLLAATRLVGMECPGLHSVFSGFALDFDAAAPAAPALSYAVSRYDPRFRFLEMAVEGGGARGAIRALVRARPVAQPSLPELAALVPPGCFAGRRALVVGGSRGLGETCAKLLAAGGAEVALTYARGAADAARVAAEIAAAGGSARALPLEVGAVPPDWAGGLDGWAPDEIFYFATPRIRPTQDRRFSAEAYAAFHAVYVDGFLKVFSLLNRGQLTGVFYPSSVYVEERPARFSEYVAAKAAGEGVCAALAALNPGIRFTVPRLPRLASDQTSEREPAAAPALLAVLGAADG